MFFYFCSAPHKCPPLVTFSNKKKKNHYNYQSKQFLFRVFFRYKSRIVIRLVTKKIVWKEQKKSEYQKTTMQSKKPLFLSFFFGLITLQKQMSSNFCISNSNSETKIVSLLSWLRKKKRNKLIYVSNVLSLFPPFYNLILLLLLPLLPWLPN